MVHSLYNRLQIEQGENFVIALVYSTENAVTLLAVLH